MSDKQTDADPVLEHLFARKDALVEKLRETNTRLSEIDELIEVIRDGRSRLNRQRKARGTSGGNSTAADGEKPTTTLAGLNPAMTNYAERTADDAGAAA